MNRPKIKICGITNEEDALRLAYLPVDALGFIVVKKDFPSRISVDDATKIISELSPFVTSVVAPSLKHNSLEEVMEICQKTKPDALQIQYGGTRSEIGKIRKEFGWMKIIKTINVMGKEAIGEAKGFFKIVDMINVDNKGRKEATVPLTMDQYWRIAREIVDICPKPVMLAGGLNSENVGGAIRAVRPYAVDVISGVETIPGKKDFKKVNAFLKAVEKTDSLVYGGT
jgi:phosphoribosylanthranilate isomerase